jgi:hypothetical protein
MFEYIKSAQTDRAPLASYENLIDESMRIVALASKRLVQSAPALCNSCATVLGRTTQTDLSPPSLELGVRGFGTCLCLESLTPNGHTKQR